MELDERSSLFLKYFQELHFSQKLQNGSPSERADVWRNHLVQIDFANISKLLTNEGANILLDEYRGRYLDIVDDFNEETGLNNFAEGALALCSLHRNESQDWESSFSVNSIMKMNCIQELQKETMTSAKRLLPPGTETSILTPIRKSPADDGDYQFAAQDLSLLQSGSVNKSEHTNGTSVMRSTQWSDSNRCAATLFKNIDPSINDSGPAYLKQKPLFGSVKSQDSSINILPIHESSSLNRKQELLKGSQSDVDMESDDLEGTVTHFRTALDEFNAANLKYGKNKESVSSAAYGSGRKCLGTRRGPSSKFTPPVINKGQREFGFPEQCGPSKTLMLGRCEENTDDRLKGIEPKMVELIMNEIMDHGPSISWNDVAGLEFAKKTIKEIVVWPMLRPDIFTGLRGPPKGLLLFGPPGTGKTLIGKCIASQSKSTFFSISASSLTSKWVGEGEKMVRAMFTVARCHQPVVIFIDEIDSLLSQRSETEHESSRKIKTEFLVQLDGVATESDERILVVGATNRPQEIDEAARRRFVKRLYIPLPEAAARRQIVQNLLCNQKHHLMDEELETLCQKSEGYSGADMTNLCREAALGPIRSISFGEIESIRADQVRPITYCDFQEAFLQVKASVSVRDLEVYMNWNEMYGSGGN